MNELVSIPAYDLSPQEKSVASVTILNNEIDNHYNIITTHFITRVPILWGFEPKNSPVYVEKNNDEEILHYDIKCMMEGENYELVWYGNTTIIKLQDGQVKIFTKNNHD